MRWLSVIFLVLMLPVLPAVPVAAEQERLRVVPDSPSRVAKLLRLLKRTADERQARRLREQVQRAWIAAGPASAQVLLKQAARAQAAGLRDTAEEMLRLVVRRWPDYAEGRYRLAFFLWQTRRSGQALAELDALLARQPDHFPALALKVRLLAELKRRRQALDACRVLLARFPAWADMRRRCERLRRRLEQDV